MLLIEFQKSAWNKFILAFYSMDESIYNRVTTLGVGKIFMTPVPFENVCLDGIANATQQ